MGFFELSPELRGVSELFLGSQEVRKKSRFLSLSFQKKSNKNTALWITRIGL